MPNPNFLTANTSSIELMPGVNDTALGYDVNRIIQALNGTNLVPITTGNLSVIGTLSVTGLVTLSTIVGPLTINPGGLIVSTGGVAITLGGLTVSAGGISVTGNSTITGTLGGLTGLTVASGGASVVGGLVTDTLHVTSTSALDGDVTIGARLIFSTAVAKIIPGATSISLRNNADNADNVLITDSGNVTIRGLLTTTSTAPGINFNYAATAAGTGAAPTLPANTPTGATGGTGKWILTQLNGVATYILGWQ